MEEQEIDVEVPSWFSDTFDAIGANYVEKDGKVAADTPWGSGYIPTRYADLNVTEREQADAMTKRWDEDDNFTMLEQANGTKTYVDKTSGFSANTDQLMLTANAEGKYEVASMFDIGMFTGAISEARDELNIQKAMLGLDTDTKEDNQGPAEATNKQTVAAGGKPVEEGNIDINNREVQNNADGSISTEKSMSVNIDGKEVLIPTVIGGKEVPEEEAIAHYERTGEHLGKFETPEDANAYAEGLHNEQDMKYNNGIAGEMLKTDLSNDTSVAGEASPYIVAKGDTFSYVGANGKEITLESDAYDLDLIKQKGAKVQGAVEKALESKGIDKNDPKYAEYFNEVRGMFTDQIIEGAKHTVTDMPEKPTKETRANDYANEKVHWTDREGTQDKKKRVFVNKYSDENNYGNYKSKNEWEKAWKNTFNIYNSTKLSAAEKKEAKHMAQNVNLYRDLGIATPAQVKAYESDRKIHEAAMKSAGTTSGIRMANKERAANVRAEVSDQLYKELENPDVAAIDVVGKLTRHQVGAFYANRDEKNKPTKQQSEKLVALRDSGTRIRRMQELANGADLEAMEKVSPIDRAGVFISKFFGGAKDKQLKTVLLSMAKDEMVSRTVKEISGAAASDQERAFIKSWLLGADGASVQQFRSTLNSIQERVYGDAKKFGERLYMQGKIGALYELSQDTGDLKDLPKPKKIEKVK